MQNPWFEESANFLNTAICSSACLRWRDVASDAPIPEVFPLRVRERDAIDAQPHAMSGLVQANALHARCGSLGLDDPANRLGNAIRVLRAVRSRAASCRGPVGRASQQKFDARTHVSKSSFAVHFPDQVAGGLDEGAILFPALKESFLDPLAFGDFGLELGGAFLDPLFERLVVVRLLFGQLVEACRQQSDLVVAHGADWPQASILIAASRQAKVVRDGRQTPLDDQIKRDKDEGHEHDQPDGDGHQLIGRRFRNRGLDRFQGNADDIQRDHLAERASRIASSSRSARSTPAELRPPCHDSEGNSARRGAG